MLILYICYDILVNNYGEFEMKSLILIDANGSYTDGKHKAFKHITDEFYDRIAEAIKSGEYNTIIYLPNIPQIKTVYEWKKALSTDPILIRLSKDEIKSLIILPHGFENKLEDSEAVEECVKIEDNLAKTTSITLGGLYRDWCVQSHFESLKSRNPGADICISPELSLDSSPSFSHLL